MSKESDNDSEDVEDVEEVQIEKVKIEAEGPKIIFDSFGELITNLDMCKDVLEHGYVDAEDIEVSILGREAPWEGYGEVEDLIKTLTGKFRDVKEENHNYRQKINRLETDNERLNLELREVEQELEEAIIDVQNFKELYKERVNELNEKKEELDELRSEIEETTDKYATRPEEIETTQEDIGGLDEEYQELLGAIKLPMKAPPVYGEGKELKATGGALLYGPPGTGKTESMKALAKEAGATLYKIDGPEIISKWVGSSEKKLRNIHKAAKMNSPSIIMIDEIDALVTERGSSSSNNVNNRVVGTLNSLMNGTEENKHVYWTATTNRLDQLDSALLRPGRFDKKIEFGLPGEKATYEIAEIHLPEGIHKSVADKITSNEEYMEVNTGAVIKQVKREAVEDYLLDKHSQDSEGRLVSDNWGIEEVNKKYFMEAVDKVYQSELKKKEEKEIQVDGFKTKEQEDM